MMHTHPDLEHEGDKRNREFFENFKKLEAEADRMVAAGESKITAGDEGEEVVREWESSGILVREFPEREIDEPLDLVRISAGGVAGHEGYLVFRGPTREVRWMLRRALNALRDAP